jgi:hypothetical protein
MLPEFARPLMLDIRNSSLLLPISNATSQQDWKQVICLALLAHHYVLITLSFLSVWMSHDIICAQIQPAATVQTLTDPLSSTHLPVVGSKCSGRKAPAKRPRADTVMFDGQNRCEATLKHSIRWPVYIGASAWVPGLTSWGTDLHVYDEKLASH